MVGSMIGEGVGGVEREGEQKERERERERCSGGTGKKGEERGEKNL